MKKRLLSALLTLCMVLTLIPTTAATAMAEPKASSPIYAVYFRFKNPAFSEKSDQASEVDKLRNVVWVNLDKSAVEYKGDYKGADGYDYEVSLGDTPITISKYYYSSTNNSVLFEIPKEKLQELSSSNNTLKLKVSIKEKDGSEIGSNEDKTLVKLTWKKEDGCEFNDADKEKIPDDGTNAIIYAQAGDTYPNLPELKDKVDGSEEFIDWYTSEGKTDDTRLKKIPDNATPIYPEFGEKERKEIEVKEVKENGEQNENLTENSKFVEAKMEYGNAEQGKITLRVRNTGNTTIENVYSQLPEHFEKVEYTPEEEVSEAEGTPTSYTIPEGKYLDIAYKPNESTPVGKYEKISFWIMDKSGPIGQISIKLEVTEKTYTIALTDGSNKVEKTYDEHWTGLDNEKWKVTEPQDVQQDQLNISFSSEGFDEGAPVNGEEGYPITVESNDPNYTVTWAQDAKVVVKKANIIPSDENPTVTVTDGHTLEGIPIPVTFTNEKTGTPVDEATPQWTDAQKRWDLSENGQTASYTLKFSPDSEAGNYESYTGTVTVHVVNLPAVKLTPSLENASYEYNGEKVKPVTFTVEPVDPGDKGKQLPTDVTVTYKKDGTAEEAKEEVPTDVGEYTVTATSKANGTFAAGTGTAHLTITPRRVAVSFTVTGKKVYDGTNTATVKHQSIDRLLEKDRAGVSVQETYKAAFRAYTAGEQTIDITGIALEGERAFNYEVKNTTAHLSASIAQRPVKIEIREDIEKPYGTERLLTYDDFTVSAEQETDGGLVSGDNNASLHLQLTSTGTAKLADVNADGYPIITNTPSNGNYTVTVENEETVTMKVTPAKAVRKGDVTASDAMKNAKLSTSKLHGTFVNENDDTLIAPGTLKWTTDETLPGDETEQVTREWTFTPDDPNYDTNPITGTATITLRDKHVLTITLDETKFEYTGYSPVVTGTVTHECGAQDEQHEFDDEFQKTPQIKYEVDGDIRDVAPEDVGHYKIIASVPETEHFAGQQMEDWLDISPVPPIVQKNKTILLQEGATLNDIKIAELGLNGVGPDGPFTTGTLTWTVGGTTVAEAGMSYEYLFQPSDPNYTEVEGSVTIQFTPDERDIQAKVYNLPDASYTDYAVLTLNPPRNELKPGEVVTFYSDSNCTKPISADYTVPAGGASGTVSIDLEGGTLNAAGGEIYAKISNKSSSKPRAISYDPEPGEDLSLAVPSVTIGSPKALPKVGDNDPYEILSIKWSMGENEYAELTEENGSYTLKGLKPGTVTLTASVVYQHPDPAKSGEHITVTRTMTISIVNPQSSGGFAGGGFGGAPSATQKPTITGDSAHVDWTLGADGSTLTITPKPGYEIEDVTVNGVSKGAVNFLSGLKTGDQIAIKVKPILDEEAQQKIEHLRKGVEKTTLKASSKTTKKGIRIDWKKSKGYKVDYYEVFRSLKRNSGFGKSAYYKTPNGNKTYYINTKELKKGTRYYYRVRGVRKLEDGTVAYTHWSTKAWRKSPVTRK